MAFNIQEIIEKRFREGQEVQITKSTTGKTNMNSIGNVTYIRVSKEEYDIAIQKINELNQEKRKKQEAQKRIETRKNNAYDREMESILARSPKNPQGQITDIITKANTMPVEKYKHNIKENEKPRKQKSNKPKRTLKNRVRDFIIGRTLKRNINKFTKEELKKRTIRGVASGLVFGVALGAGIPAIVETVKSEQQVTFEEALQAVKEEIAKNINAEAKDIKIYDESTPITSNTAKEHYIIEVNKKQYSTYIYYDEDGKREVQRDDIRNEEVINAIKAVGRAQNGDIIDVGRAKNLTKKIKDGEVDFSLPEILKARQGQER